MPVKTHEAVAEPPDDLVVWRYMDLAKFVWLLDAGALWFARADTLGDPFEGAVLLGPEGRERVREHRKVMRENFGGAPIALLDSSPEALRAVIEDMTTPPVPRLCGVNSWHASEGESAALWRIYAPQGMGVAVRSTVGRLKHALRDDPTTVYVGQVTYHDYDRENVGAENLLRTMLRKRRSFEHEREVRGLVFPLPGLDMGGPKPLGVAVKAHIPDLIEAIRVDPEAAPYVIQAIRGVTVAMGLDKALVGQSSLASDEPLFL